MHEPIRAHSLLVTAVLLVTCLAACAGGAAAPSTPASSGAPLEPSAPAASTVPSEGGSVGAIASADAAAQAVIDHDPRFSGFEPEDPEIIGACCWWTAEETADGWEVTMHAGWGDCPAGCINRHEWVYGVSPAGDVELLRESGDPVPPGELPG